MHFSVNYTFWLNLIFVAWGLCLFWINRRNPMQHDMACCGGHRHSSERAA